MPLLVLLIVAVASGAATTVGARALILRESAASLLALSCGSAIVGATAVAVLALIVSRTGLLDGLDREASRWAYDNASAFSHRALSTVTDLGETWMVLIVASAVAVIDLVRRRNLWTPTFLVLVILGDKLLTQELKQLVDRARPTLEPVAATLGPSFPSGHSSTAAASWAAFAFLAAISPARRFWPLLAGLAVAIAVAVAASRVLLDVHWLTDVIGGLALGWAWLALCVMAFASPLFTAPEKQTGPGRIWTRRKP